MSEPERIDGLTYADYHGAEGIRASELKDIARSPLDCWHRRRNPMQETAALRIGKAGHTSASQPRRFLDEYALFDGTRRGKAWEAFRGDAQNAGKTILNRAEYELAVSIGEAVQSHPVAGPMLVGGAAEVSLFWTDRETGLPCKARPDYLTRLTMPDLKTTRDPSPRAFAAVCARLGYPLQLAHYLEGVRQVCGDEPEPYLIAVGSAPPHDVVVYRVPPHVIELGEEQRRDAMQTMAQMLERYGERPWPGIAPDAAVDLELPRWAWPDAGELVLEDDEVAA